MDTSRAFNTVDQKGSPWMGMSSQLNGRFSFCKITNVNEKRGLVDVRTYGDDPVTGDMSLYNVMCMAMDAHPDGDISGSLPRRGSHGVVIFIGSTPVVLGYIRLMDKAGATQDPNSANALSEGDKLIGSIGDSRIIIRSGGIIEIQGSNICRTYYIPGKEIIQQLCKRYELYTDAGNVRWENNDGTTTCKTEYKNKLYKVYTEFGTPDKTDPLVCGKVQVGLEVLPGEPPPIPNIDFQFKTTGEMELIINKVALKIKISPTGTIDVESIAGSYNFKTVTGSINMESQTGDITAKTTSGTINLENTAGDVNVKTTAGDANIEALNCKIDALSGCKVTAKKSLDIESLGPCNIKSTAAMTVQSTAPCTVKSSSTVSIEGTLITIKGAGPMGKPLVSPYALSDFTGKPIVPGSNSVNMTG